MVVLVILGLLAGLVGPRLFGKVDQSKVQTAQTQIKMLRGALQGYRLDIGRYPSSAEGLAALMRAPPDVAAYWIGPYLEDELPLDPWRTPYRYEQPADNLQGFALYSLGADSTDGRRGLRCRHRLSAGKELIAVGSSRPLHFAPEAGEAPPVIRRSARPSPRRRPASLASGLPRAPIHSP